MSSIELRQRRAALVAEARAIDERPGERSAEEREQIDRLLDTSDQLRDEITRAERLETDERDLAAAMLRDRPEPAHPDDPESARRTAFGVYLRGGASNLSPEQRQFLAPVDPEIRAAAAGTGSAGGYTVPAGFRDVLTETQKAYGGIANIADRIVTTTGQSLPWPTVDDTGNVGAILSENSQVTEQDFTFGQATLGAYMYTSKLVRVSIQLLEDSAFDLETWLARKLGERLGRAQAAHFATGTGSSQPQGAATGASSGKVGTTGQTATVIYDDLVDLVYSVDAAYRQSGRCAFVLNDASIKVIRKLKDSQNRPIWEVNTQVGQPDSLLGYPIVTDNGIATMAANAKSILFGDFTAGYVVRTVNDVVLLRLAERYADYLQVGFLAFQRADGLVQDSGAIKYYQNSAT